jgi:hypothetical protein
MSLDEAGYVQLARGVLTPPTPNPEGYIAAPGSGATITLWQSAPTPSNDRRSIGPNRGRRFKRLVVNIYSSHASAVNGLAFQESQDETNWRDVVTYTIAATTYTKNYVAVSAPFVRVVYTNSAAVLTAWEMSVLGDAYERAAP